MYKNILFTVLLGFSTQLSIAQISFSDATSNLNDTTLKSGCAMAVVDMNNDGLDDVIRLNGASDLRIEFQQANGSFAKLAVGNVNNAWGIAIADVDENGYNDIIAGGFNNGLTLVSANGTGTAYTISTITGPSIFLQNANFADINNDGEIDFFGCHDNGLSTPYENDGDGLLTHNAGLIDTSSTVPSDNSGNYGSIWTDYDNDGDLDFYISKCRLGVSNPLDGRRLNLLFQNDGNNNFTEVAPAAGLQPQLQSWSSAFDDLDNDGDFDVVMINHPADSEIYLNNGNGTFTDITSTSGIATELADLGKGIQVITEDFDNDGYIDILITTRDDPHYLFLNDGDNTFTTVSAPFTTPSGTRIQSAASGDLNNDGFMDIIAGYATGYNGPSSTNSDQMFFNTSPASGNTNNWSRVRLEGVISNSTGIGAKVELHGAWGTQVREVRSGESYGTVNSFVSHFGMGSATTIDKVVVKWPSGIVDEILTPTHSTTLLITEGENITCPSTTTWDGANWDNGAPKLSSAAIIDGDYVAGSGGGEFPSINACSLTINATNTVTIKDGFYANIASDITVDGTLNIEDKASLVQVANAAIVANNGAISVLKTTPSLIDKSFMIMGSPMSAETRTGVFSNSILVKHHLTGNFVPHPDVTANYPGTENFADDNGDNWADYSGGINPGEGYLVRPYPNNNSSGIFNLDHTLGTLNNGVINFSVLFNTDQNSSPNVLANPYASAINAKSFMDANSMIDALYFWEHLSPANISFPGYRAANYDMRDISIYNTGSGGIAAANGGSIPGRFIASGQGFGIKASSAGTAVFYNSMRVKDNNDNFRSNNNSAERDRIWLKVSNSTYSLESSLLVAFVSGATDGFEKRFDTRRMATPLSMYSILDSGIELAIQGRTLFTEDQKVTLGFSSDVKESQTYTITIQQLEGVLLRESTVYLKDHLLQSITNLTETDYEFVASEGSQNNRFTLVFNNDLLGFEQNEFTSSLVVYPNPAGNTITIKTNLEFENTSVVVYDLTGRQVIQKTLSGSASLSLDISKLKAGLYFLRIKDRSVKFIKK